MKRATFKSDSIDATREIASSIAQSLAQGTCIALEGDLGAGKTTFVRGLVEALGGDANAVSSPTFMLLNIYPTPQMTVFHLDAYRVGGGDDFEAIGFSELLEQKGLVIVEWASRVAELVPRDRIDIRIRSTGETSRLFEVTYTSQP